MSTNESQDKPMAQPVWYCLACGTENPRSARICRECGRALRVTPRQQQEGVAFLLNELEALRQEGEIDERDLAAQTASTATASDRCGDIITATEKIDGITWDIVLVADSTGFYRDADRHPVAQTTSRPTASERPGDIITATEKIDGAVWKIVLARDPTGFYTEVDRQPVHRL